MTTSPPPPAGFGAVDDPRDAVAAARASWDADADDYLARHRGSLGAVRFSWGPERYEEDEAELLGPVAELAARGARVLEIGAGAAQCGRWLASRGVGVLSTDLSPGMLAAARRLDAETGVPVPTLACDARALPLADASFDVVFTAYGALPFVADADRVLSEAARVLRPGGRLVFSVTHPVRWAFPDHGDERGLTASFRYFDRRPYVEHAEDGSLAYAEFHRTVGDWVRLVVGAGFVLSDLVEPEWTEAAEDWDGWTALRAEHLPGTLIVVAHLPG
jgi:SAM-dependent methyltransferase